MRHKNIILVIKNIITIIAVLFCTAAKAFLDKQHLERDSLFEQVATLTMEPSFSIEKDVNKIMNALEK